MAYANSALQQARLAKKDEFYTQLHDIENEMRYYRKHFKGKTILCNCDDPFESNFFKYFVLNFNRLGLKKLIATCYTGSPIAGTQLSFADLGKEFVGSERAYKAIVTEVYDVTGNGGVDMLDVAELFKLGKNTIEELKGDGDFRSSECLELLDEADIIVTNPPFSLFREFIETLVSKDKSFIILGNVNATTYKEVFPLLKANRLWIGASIHSGDRAFYVPDDYPLSASGCGVDETGRKFIRVKGVRWFTNLDIKQRHEELILIRRYNSEDYPSYSNFEGIDVKKVSEIPFDYSGCMGVPLTFFDKYNPDQFEIIGLGMGDLAKEIGITRNTEGRTKLEYQLSDGSFKRPYSRVLIRNKHPEQPKA